MRAATTTNVPSIAIVSRTPSGVSIAVGAAGAIELPVIAVASLRDVTDTGPVRALVVITLAAGCIEPSLVPCGDGTLCPVGSVCTPSGCVTDQQLAACVGHADGDSCDLSLGDGLCVAGVCIVGRCGDGVLGPGESCDDGNTAAGDACLPDCQLPGCGDGFLDPEREVCDDHNRIDSDGCARDCLSDETCGNGIRDAMEQCDDGNAQGGDACTPNCKLPACGDGYIDELAGEVCDDSNQDDDDGCARDCRSDETCGNGIRDPGEDCDLGAANSDDPDAECRPNCELRRCGDAIVDPASFEACDDGNNVGFDACLADCTPNVCGDGIRLVVGSPGQIEECDDANLDPFDYCTATCKVARCGDGVLHAGVEECDGTPNCRGDCTPAVCGDQVLEADEECEAPTWVPGSAFCTNACKLPCGSWAWGARRFMSAFNSCYALFGYFENGLPFWEAEAECVALGGHLAWVTSAAENTVLKTLDYYNDEPWIGLHDSGTWTWTSGDAFGYSNLAPPPVPAPALPHCASLTSDGTWNTQPCAAGLAYICRIPNP